MRWAGNAARIEEKRKAHKVLIGKSETNILLEKPRHR
jgi:hypothetical protein